MKKYLLTLLALVLGLGARGQEAIELINVSPDAGSAYSINMENITFRFDRAVTVEAAGIETAAGTFAIENGFNSDAFYHLYYCPIAELVKGLLQNGQLKAGERFTVRLDGVKDAADPSVQFGTDGTVSVSFVAAALPVRYLGAVPADNSVLKSYYAPGDDAAKVVLSFDGEVSTCDKACFRYGDLDDGFMRTVDVPYTIEGERLVVDLGGVKLDKASLNDYTAILLIVGPIRSADGELVESNVQGAPGSVMLNYDIEQETASPVYGGFDSGDIDGASIEGWVSAGVAFDFVRFAFTLGGQPAAVDLPADRVRTEAAPEEGYPDAVTLTVPLDGFGFDAGTVAVSLVNATDAEGKALTIEGTYTSKGRAADRSLCLAIDPAPGELVASPSQFRFAFNVPATVEKAEMRLGGDVLDVTDVCTVENNVVTVMTRRDQTFQGNFSLVLKVKDPDGAYITYGETPDEVRAGYGVSQYTYGCVAITPAAGAVKSLKEFGMEFANPADPNDFLGGFNPENKATLLDAEGRTVTTGSFREGENWTGQVVLTLEKEITDAGVYTLVVPAATVFNSLYDGNVADYGLQWGAVCNPELRFVYTLGSTGVGTVQAADEAVEVYDLRGVLVAKGKASEVLPRLPRGLYVAGGRKVSVK